MELLWRLLVIFVLGGSGEKRLQLGGGGSNGIVVGMHGLLKCLFHTHSFGVCFWFLFCVESGYTCNFSLLAFVSLNIITELTLFSLRDKTSLEGKN